VNQSLIKVEDLATGQTFMEHEKNLKLMPRKVLPDDVSMSGLPVFSHAPMSAGASAPWEPRFTMVPACGDGACFIRAVTMAEELQRGTPLEALVDCGDAAFEMRQKLVLNMRNWLNHLQPGRRKEVETEVRAEMEQDPSWKSPVKWNWEKFFTYLRQPHTFSTHIVLGTFCRMNGRNLELHEVQDDGSMAVVYREPAPFGNDNETFHLLRSPNHYDLLWPRVVKRRVTGKMSPEVVSKKPRVSE
jgi:hypothetical protein